MQALYGKPYLSANCLATRGKSFSATSYKSNPGSSCPSYSSIWFYSSKPDNTKELNGDYDSFWFEGYIIEGILPIFCYIISSNFLKKKYL